MKAKPKKDDGNDEVKSSGLASELAREQLTCQRLQEASLTAARQKELLDDELQALKGEAKDLRLDGRRLLLRSSFQAWRARSVLGHGVFVSVPAYLSPMEASVQHNSERSSQDGKVKEAFRRASQAERDAASEKFACQRLQEELREAQQQLDAEAIIQKSKAAAQEALIETQRMERARLEEQLAMAMRCAEVQAQLLAQAEISESRREVAQLRAELSCRATEMSSLPSHLWRSPDSLTHALIHASMGVRSMSNGYHNSVNSSWESIKVRPRGQEKYMTLLQSSSGAVASLLKQASSVRRLDDAHRTLSTGRNAVLGATPAQLRAVQALEKQTSMLERTNQEWTASFGFHSMEDAYDLDDDLARQSGISVLDDEVSASERGAAMVRMLRRTEGRLERLQDRLQGLLSSPVSRRESPRRSPPEGW
eukprot:g28210.t1